MARTFNGSTDNINLGTSLGSISGPLSIAFWFMPFGTPLFGNYYPQVSCNRWGVTYQNDTNTSSAPGMLFNANQTGPFCAYVHTFTLNAWLQCTCTYDNTNARMYINGPLVAGPTAVTAGGTTTNVLLGQSGTRFMWGRLGDFAVWNVTLTAFEANLLAQGVRPYQLRGGGSLKAWFPLDGIGSVDADLSGNAIQPTINGTLGGYPPPTMQQTPRNSAALAPGISVTTFRRTLSSVGTRTGSRQRIMG